MAAKIKKGDKVVVLTGRDKGRSGEVIQVMPKDEPRAGARRQHGDAPSAADGGAGGRADPQGSADPPVEYRDRRSDDGKPTRVGFKTLKDGRKVRFAKRSGETIDG